MAFGVEDRNIAGIVERYAQEEMDRDVEVVELKYHHRNGNVYTLVKPIGPREVDTPEMWTVVLEESETGYVVCADSEDVTVFNEAPGFLAQKR